MVTVGERQPITEYCASQLRMWIILYLIQLVISFRGYYTEYDNLQPEEFIMMILEPIKIY